MKFQVLVLYKDENVMKCEQYPTSNQRQNDTPFLINGKGFSRRIESSLMLLWKLALFGCFATPV